MERQSFSSRGNLHENVERGRGHDETVDVFMHIFLKNNVQTLIPRKQMTTNFSLSL